MADSRSQLLFPPVLGALLGGTCVGLVESLHILGQAFGTRDYSGIFQAVVLYGGAGLIAGALLAAGALLLYLAFGAMPDPSRSWTVSWLAVFCGAGFFVARGVIARDFLQTEVLTGPAQLWLLLGVVSFGVVFYLFTRNALKKTFFSFLLHPLGTGATYGGLLLFTLLFALGSALNNRAGSDVAPRPVAPSLTERPNLLLVAVRDLDLESVPPDELDRLAPNLARLQRESVVFTQAMAHAPAPRESFASLLTAQVPCAHRAVGPTAVLPEEVDTLAEVLGRQGYTTGAVVTQVGVSPSFNFGQGYDTFEFLRPRWLLRASEASYRLTIQALLHRWLRPASVVAGSADRHYRDATEVSGAAVDWLRRHGSERWFLTLQFSDLGLPLVQHPQVARLAAEPLAQASGGGGLSEADRDAAYRGELAWLDRGLGTIIEYLDEHDLLDISAVAVVGLQRNAEMEGGSPLSDERLRVPLMLRLPDADARSGRRVADPVRLVDLAPTLTELGGAQEGADWQGVPLLREYALRDSSQRAAYLEESVTGARAVRDGAWKLTSERRADGSTREALFFLSEDPLERDNLAHRDAARWKLDQKREELARLEQELCHSAPRAMPPRSRGGQPLTIEDCEVLRRLGYQEGFSERCSELGP